MIRKQYIFVFMAVVPGWLTLAVSAQSPEDTVEIIRILHADDWLFDDKIESEAQRLVGNVRFKHKGALLFCDSAYFFSETNQLSAYGRVQIREGDSLRLFGDTLYYDGGTHYANLTGNIRMLDQKNELTTHYLDFNRRNGVASYQGGGRIISPQNRNVLSSKTGAYHTFTHEVFFKDSVVLRHPDYIVKSDTLHYHTHTEVASFSGPTQIVSDRHTIYTTKGWYDTKHDRSQFMNHSRIRAGEQTLEGDTLYYNRKTGIGEAFGNIAYTDTTDHILLTGNYAIRKDAGQRTMITGKPVFTQISGSDSLYLHADTILATKDRSGMHHLIRAWYHVKFYRKDLQGKCDSLAWSEADSSLQMFRDPIIWSEGNQLTGDHIAIQTWSGKIRKLKITNRAFIASEYDSIYYNQIKGLHINGWFANNVLYKILVEGNGQTIYFAEGEKNDEEKKDTTGSAAMHTLGMNDAVCSDILIYIADQKIRTLTLIDQPTATLYPMHKLPPKSLLLNGFGWHGHHRPGQKEDIFKWYNGPAPTSVSRADADNTPPQTP